MKCYAGRHTHGTEFTYNGGGWDAYVFAHKMEREKFIFETNSRDSQGGYNQRSETITRANARKITGQNVKEELMDGYDGYRLVAANDYHNANYWS